MINTLTNLSNETVPIVLNEIAFLVDEIVQNELSFELLDEKIRKLEQLIFDFDLEDQSIGNSYYESLDAAVIKKINDSYCKWETIHETRFAESLLTGEITSIKEYILHDRFKDLISNELNLLKDQSFESVLFIGSGPFPITAIFLHHYTNKVIDCLEIDQKAADISNEILKKLGLQDKIRIHVGDGCVFDLSKYDIVLNALLAKPKGGILKNIRLTNTNAKILCRTSYGLRRLVYEPAPGNVTTGFIEMDKQIAEKDFTISTLYLINRTVVTDNLNFKWIYSLDESEKEKLSCMMNEIIGKDNNNGFLSVMHKDHPYMKVLEKDIDFGTKHLLVIENEDGLYLGQFIIDHSYVETYKLRAEISTLMINETIRGKEVSLQIIENLFDKCDSLGIKYLTLTVRAGSKVELLWKHLGFETFGVLPHYSNVGETQYSGVYMYKDIETLKKNLHRKMESMYSFN